MAEISNLVRQTSSSTGTGNLSLAAVNGYRTFNTAFGTGTSDKFYYFIANRQAAEWEVGTGHLSDATTLVRDTVLASSNSNSAVNFSAGTKDVMNDLPADKQVNADDLAAVATTGAYGDLSGTPSLGTAAASDTGDFATAAQGSAADTAVQPGDLAAVATSGDYGDLTNKPTLGSAAAADTGDFATAAQGTAADNALPKAGGTMTGNIAFSGSQTVDGRDLSADGSKLDGIESGADVTDATNVAAAGAAMLGTEAQSASGGVNVVVKDLGSLSGNTITPDPGNRAIQKITNDGAGTIAPGSNYGAYLIVLVNVSGAGAVTTSGFTSVAGDDLTTTNGHKFLGHVVVTADFSSLIWMAMQ